MINPRSSRSSPQSNLPRRGLSIPDAATYLGVTSSFIRHAIYSGELPSAILGKRYIIDIKDLDALLEREKQARTLDKSEAA